MLNDAAKPKTSKPSNSIRESKIFQSLDNVLSEMSELEQSLENTLEKRISEIGTSINNMKARIQKDTEDKMNTLLSDNQKLISLLDVINSNAVGRLKKLSEDKQINTNLRTFDQNFSKLNLNELSEKSKRLQCDVEKCIVDLNEFKLNFSLELYPKSDVDNQIGRIVEQFDENNISFGSHSIRILSDKKPNEKNPQRRLFVIPYPSDK